MRDAHKTALVRLVVCYLIAAGVQMLVLAVGAGEPHGGMGPVVFGVVFVFWAAPFMTAAQMADAGGLDATQVKSLLYFVVAFAICFVIAFRRELRRWN
jgi:hypothetical protein